MHLIRRLTNCTFYFGHNWFWTHHRTCFWNDHHSTIWRIGYDCYCIVYITACQPFLKLLVDTFILKEFTTSVCYLKINSSISVIVLKCGWFISPICNFSVNSNQFLKLLLMLKQCRRFLHRKTLILFFCCTFSNTRQTNVGLKYFSNPYFLMRAAVYWVQDSFSIINPCPAILYIETVVIVIFSKYPSIIMASFRISHHQLLWFPFDPVKYHMTKSPIGISTFINFPWAKPMTY